jgi:putative hydrolase of the HAD superfamily
VGDAVCQQAASVLLDAIHADHRRARERGIEYPEVDIVAIWRRTIEDLRERGLLDVAPDEADLQRVAVEYEVRTNPGWPMPGVAACLEALRARDLPLGIISNAQFFTPLLFPALLSRSLETLGFSPRLQFYSYQVGSAKPGLALYERAAAAVAASGWCSHNVLFIGNDMLNDVAAARQVGFRTALFAGDGRSLRARDGDPRVEGVRPDLVVTHLSQLVDCIA